MTDEGHDEPVLTIADWARDRATRADPQATHSPDDPDHLRDRLAELRGKETR